MPRIESTRNDTVKLLRSLDSAKGREQSGLFLVEGDKLCRDALEAGLSIALCLYDPARCQAMALEAEAAGAAIYETNDAALEAAASTRSPQGIVMAARLPARVTLDRPPLLALDGVQDPGNVGTMLRTAEAAGFGGALLGAGCADPFAPKTVRGSMGASFRLPLEYGVDLPARLHALRQAGWCVAATVMEGEDFFHRGAMPQRRVLLIGSEGSGLSREALAHCDRRLTLPMAGGAQSLNAAVAAGIMMFDWFREATSPQPG